LHSVALAAYEVTVKITRAGLRSIDLEKMRPFVGASEWFYAESGVEHHKLLAYLASTFRDRDIFDVGTHLGDSAHALSYETSNRVHSFDIVDKVAGHRRQRSNITYHRDDLFHPTTREVWKTQLLNSAIVFIDVDPHDGGREYELVSWLQTNDYRGLIVLDDIWHFKAMRDHLWYRIEDRHKLDVTHVGHWSGTGIVSFADPISCEDSFRAADTSNWTLVTGYFDLTRQPDASPAIRSRPSAYYLEDHGQSTLSLEQNLVVFCEPESEAKVWALRPTWLHSRTKVVTQSFDDFPLARHRDRIIANRGGGPCPSDSRNTASYYLFCMARCAMLKKAIADNPFASTHFAWINICIERMGPSNVRHLTEALCQQRSKFSTCYIDYRDEATTRDLSLNFGTACVGRCTMCSGFYTGDAAYMGQVCDRVEQKFVECLERGYGHADEQLFNLVYFDAPDLFDWYVGDYQEMITNYAQVYERPERPLHQVIRNSRSARDWAVCSRACAILWDSIQNGACTLSDADAVTLAKVRSVANFELGLLKEANSP
jgi:hypothetical protein